MSMEWLSHFASALLEYAKTQVVYKVSRVEKRIKQLVLREVAVVRDVFRLTADG